MRTQPRVIVAILVAACGAQAFAEAATDAYHCAAIHISSSPPAAAEERRLVCDAAAKAADFFHAHGVTRREPIRVRVVDEVFDRRFSHIGSYSAQTKTITLLSREQLSLEANSALFGLPMEDALYRSVVVHELAHAIADQNFAAEAPPLVVQEYIAYVAQLSTMDPSIRATILDNNSVPAYADVDELSSTYYALDPSGFGIKAYRHFISLDQPAQFLRDLLAGAITPTDLGTE